MQITLEAIENSLRRLIESSASLFSRDPSLRLVASQMVEVLFNHMQGDGEQETSVPGRYSVRLSPNGYAQWQSNPDWLIALEGILKDAARENKITFCEPLSIQLIPDKEIEGENARVEVNPYPPCDDSTAAIPMGYLNSQNSVEEPQVKAFLIVDGNRDFPLNQNIINIGRKPDNHLVLDNPRVSRQHAQLRAIRGHYVLFDLNSSAGTKVNNERVTRRILLPGDVISLAGVTLIYGEEEEMGKTDALRINDPEADSKPLSGEEK